MTDEKRHYRRVAFDAEVVMEYQGSSWVAHLIDVSLKGLLVVFPNDIAIELGNVYDMELRLGVDTVIQMRVKVMHFEDHLVGLEWSDIDLESLTHLRRLLELNMSSAEEIHRELSELG
ncbi:MAG: PilZ domain-containing protein [Gammaproteobacteria bacterium]|nr:PilZ domain-containing protein [Gammaproteobacteria bacterium]